MTVLRVAFWHERPDGYTGLVIKESRERYNYVDSIRYYHNDQLKFDLGHMDMPPHNPNGSLPPCDRSTYVWETFSTHKDYWHAVYNRIKGQGFKDLEDYVIVEMLAGQ